MMPTASPPDSGGQVLRKRAAAWWARCRSSVRCLYHPLLFLMLFIFAAILHVYFSGLPGPMVRRIEDTLNERGLDVSIGAVLWRPGQGWIVRHVVLYGTRRDFVPLAEAESIQVRLAMHSATNALVAPVQAQLKDVTVYQVLSGSDRPPEDTELLRLERAEVAVELTNDMLTVTTEGGRLNHVRIDVDARIRLPDTDEADAGWVEMLDTRLLWKSAEERGVDPAAWRDKLALLRVGEDAGVRIVYEAIDHNPSGHWCRAAWRGRDAALGAAEFDRLDGQLVVTDRVIRVPGAAFASSSGEAFIEGYWALDGSEAYVRVTNSLPGDVWQPLIPPAASAWMQDKGLYLRGSVRGELAAGPAPAEALLRDVDAVLELDDLTARGVYVARAGVQLSRRRAQWKMTNGVVEVGTEPARGTMRVHGRLDQDKRLFQGMVESTAYLDQMMSWYPSHIARRVAPLHCLSNAPVIRGVFGGELTDTGDVWFAVDAVVEDCVYRDVDIDTMNAHVVYTNERLSFAPIRVSRDEGEAEGAVHVDYRTETASMSVTGALNPRAVTRVIGPDVEQILEDFEYRGPSRTVMNGRLDFGAHRTSDLEGSFEGRDVAFMDYPMDSCRFTFTVVSNVISVSDVQTLLGGGRMYGDLLFYVYTGNEPTRYAVQCKWDNVSLQRFIAMSGGSETSAYRGLLHGQLNATGRLGTNFEDTAEGVIKISVTDGELSRLPLLGGLSQFLSKIYPGLGYLSQREFDAVGEIAHGRVYTENARIMGPSVSIKAIGKMHFDRRLDFRVRVQLLRRGAIADILRILTLPVSRLFEFRLRGTVDDPRWRPENLPKELFLIFE